MLALLAVPCGARAEPLPGIAMHGSPRETAGFDHFPYVKEDAPKGGRVTFAMQGSYDSLNPLIVKGEPADGVRDYVYESLLARAND
ncbi:MAG TPA: ABC transporter substrate-binding protein, partial [Methyloceanibacter sp.]